MVAQTFLFSLILFPCIINVLQKGFWEKDCSRELNPFSVDSELNFLIRVQVRKKTRWDILKTVRKPTLRLTREAKECRTWGRESGAWLVRMPHTESQECVLGPGSKGTKDLPSGRSLRRAVGTVFAPWTQKMTSVLTNFTLKRRKFSSHNYRRSCN